MPQNEGVDNKVDQMAASIGLSPIPTGNPTFKKGNGSSNEPTAKKVDTLAQSIGLKKKADGDNSTNGASPTPLPVKLADDKVNLSEPPPTQEEQNKAALEKSKQEIQEKNNGLLNSIDSFNKHFSTNYNPMDVFGSAEKSSDFLQQYQTKTLQTKADIEKERQQRLGSSESFGQPIPNNTNPIYNIGNFVVNSDKNIEYLKSHVVNKTIEEDRSNGVTKAQTINTIYKRIDPKNYKILKDISNESPLKQAYDIVSDEVVSADTKLKNDLLLSSKGQAELLYNKGLVDLANNNITTGTINKDPKLIKEGQNYLSEVKSEDEILKDYPALQKQKIAYNVSREIAKESGQLEGTTAEDGQTGTKLVGAGDQQIKDAMTKLGYLNDPNTKDIALSMLNQKELFSDASYLGGFGNALLRPFKELGMSVGDITHLRTEKDIESSIKKDQMFPEETEGLKGYVGKIRTAINTTGNLIGMAAIAAGTEGVGTEAGLAVKSAKQLAAYTSFGLPAYDAALKESHDFLDSDGARMTYATISSIINAEGGRLLDLGKLSNLPGVKDDVLKLAKNLTEQNISDDVAKESINNLSKKIVNAASKYGKNVTKGAAIMTGFNVAGNLQKIAFGDKSIKMEDVLPQAGKAFVDGVLGMSVLGGFGAAEDMRAEKNTTYKGFIYKMALNHDSTADIFKMAKDKGEYTEQEYNQKMKLLNTATVAKRALDAAQDETNVELNEKQKSVYVANKTAMAVLNDRIESLPKEDEGEKNKLQSQVDRLDKQNKEIFKGLDFNSVLEPLHDLKSAEQDYDNAIEEINKTGKEPANFDKIKEKFKSLQKQYSEQNKRNSDEYNEINKGKNSENKEAESEKTKGTNTEGEKNKTIADKDIVPTFEQIKLKIPENELSDTQGIITKVNNAEEINEKDLEKGQNGLYSALEAHPESAHLIEPLINKLQDYEFTTKTETGTTTEREPIEGSFAAKTKQEIKPALEHSIGGEAGVTQPDGTTKNGTLKLIDGNYVLDVDGEEPIHIGEKAITDRDLKLPSEEKAEEPIKFDKDGNVASVTFETRDGNLVSIKDPEKALDLAIQLQANAIGEIPDEAFEKAYNEVQKETQKEVPIRDNSQSKITQDEKNSSKKGGEENASEKESGSKENGKGNAPEINVVPKEGSAEPVSEAGSSTTKEESKTTTQSSNTEDRRITGIRNAVVDAGNIHKDVQPYYDKVKRRWSSLWNEVNKQVESGNLSPRDLVDTFTKKVDEIEKNRKGLKKSFSKKLILSDYENTVMLYDRVKQLNDLKNREDALTEANKNSEKLSKEENEIVTEQLKKNIRDINKNLSDGERVLRESGTQTAQALASRQMMADMFGNLASWEDYISQQYDGNPPPDLVKRAKDLQSKHKEAQEALSKHYESAFQKAAEDAYKKGFEEAKKQGGSVKENAKIKNKNLADKLRLFADKTETAFKANLPEGTQGAGASVDIQKMVANAMRHIADGIENNKGIGKLINEATDLFRGENDKAEFRNYIKDNLAKAGIQSEQDKLLANIKDDADSTNSKSITRESVNDIKKLMNGLIKDGEVNSLSELTKKTKDLLKDIYPDNSEREIRDLFSGYGLKNESKGEIENNILDIKSKAKAASKLEDLLKPVVGETALQEKNRYDKINKLLPKVEQDMRERGESIDVAPYNDAQREQMALDSSTNRVKGMVDRLAKKIAQLSKDSRDENEPVESNKNIKILNEEKDFLSKRLAEINDTKLNNVQKISRIEDLLRNRKSKIERELREGTNPLLDKKLSSSDIFDLKERIKEYNKNIKGLKEDLTPDAEKETGALNTYKQKISNDISRLESRIKNGDFAESETTKKDFTKDEKALKLEIELKKTENDFNKIKSIVNAHGESNYKKTLNTFDNYVKFNVLSNYMTLARLGMAVADNIVFTPTEQAVGMGYSALSKIPFLGTPGRMVMEKADRHSFVSPSQFKDSEWSALKATFKDGYKDAWQELKQGNSELGILYGEKSTYPIPEEYKDTWYKINSALNTVQKVHGAEKAFFKRNEFTRSYLLRKFSAERKGLNVNDPVLQHEMAGLAYKDALTSILMGDNQLASWYQKQVKGLVQSDSKIYNGIAGLAEYLTPVVKIPSNLVLMGGRAGFGWLAGAEIGMRALVELKNPESKYGLSTLKPEQADALMRNLKKGTLGLALMTAGFIQPNMFGSSTFYKNGVQQDVDSEGNPLQNGEVMFFGIKLPSWATDNPYFWSMKIGASMRHFYDYYTNEKGDDTATAVGRTASDVVIGGISEIPILGEYSGLNSVVRNPEGKYATNYFYNQLTKMSPASGFAGQLAKDFDKDENGNVIKREPSSIGQAFEMKMPGLRENVDLK
jgi:hypothetical protein